MKDMEYYRKEKEPIAQFKPDLQVLGGSSKYINPIRRMEKKKTTKDTVKSTKTTPYTPDSTT